MLTCREVVELVTAYLEDSLDGPTRRRVERHLSRCPGCAAYLDQTRTTVRLLASVPAPVLPPAACAALVEAFRDWSRGSS